MFEIQNGILNSTERNNGKKKSLLQFNKLTLNYVKLDTMDVYRSVLSSCLSYVML